MFINGPKTKTVSTTITHTNNFQKVPSVIIIFKQAISY